MQQEKLKATRILKGFSQLDMAEHLNIAPNTYGLIESGVTKLIDIDRINSISQKLGSSPFELGLLDGIGVIQNFNETVQNGAYSQTVHNDNKEIIEILKIELETKNKQIEQLIEQNKLLGNLLKNK